MNQLIKNKFHFVLIFLVCLLFLLLLMVKRGYPLNSSHSKENSIIANPNFIEIVCRYKYCSLDGSQCKKLKTSFSINLLKKQLTGGDYDSYGIFLPEDTIADVTPDHITIKQYWQVVEEPKHQFLINQFFIDRFTGALYGNHYKFDERSAYGSVKAVISQNSKGACKRIENRLF